MIQHRPAVSGEPWLRTALVARGLLVNHVAVRVGVDPKTVQHWLAGRTPHPQHRWIMAALSVRARRICGPLLPVPAPR
jgi:hypothetical protein